MSFRMLPGWALAHRKASNNTERLTPSAAVRSVVDDIERALH